MLSKIKPHDGKKNVLGVYQSDWEFNNYALFFAFNVGDWLGKRLANFCIVKVTQPFRLLFLTFVRFGFYPIFLYCVNITGTREGFFANKWVFFCLNVIFALTSGYMGSLPMRFAPEVVENEFKGKYSRKRIDQAKSAAGTFMLIFLIGGLLCGSLMSFYSVGSAVSMNTIENDKLYNDFLKGGDVQTNFLNELQKSVPDAVT